MSGVTAGVDTTTEYVIPSWSKMAAKFKMAGATGPRTSNPLYNYNVQDRTATKKKSNE